MAGNSTQTLSVYPNGTLYTNKNCPAVSGNIYMGFRTATNETQGTPVYYYWDRYSTETNLWTALTKPTDNNGCTISLSYGANYYYWPEINPDKIWYYGIKGTGGTNGTWGFMTYSISGNSWSSYTVVRNREFYETPQGAIYYAGYIWCVAQDRIIRHNPSNNSSIVYWLWNTSSSMGWYWQVDEGRIVGIQDKIFLVGGGQVNSLGGGGSTANNPGCKWLNLTTMVGGAATIAGMAYLQNPNTLVFGNQIKVYGGASLNSSLHVYDFDLNSWSASASVGQSTTYNSAMSYFEGKTYFIGGRTIGGTILDIIQSYAYYLDAPSNLRAYYINSPPSIRLTWTDNSNEETSYVIERKRSDQLQYSVLTNFDPIIGSPPVSAEYTDTNSIDIENYSYQYRIKCRKVVF